MAAQTDSPSDRAPARSLWARVREGLAEDIARGRLAPGSRLPSERELSERLGVSRVTVRRALADLERDGLIDTSLGLGRFVRWRQVEEAANELISLTRMGTSLGLTVTSRVLVARTRPSTLDEAEALSIAPGAEICELERLRLLDDVPVVVDHSVIPSARAPGLFETDFARDSLYETLARRFGVLAYRAEYSVQARAAQSPTAEFLDLCAGQPVLVAEQTTADPAGRLFQLSTLTYRGDRYRFRSTLQLRQPPVADPSVRPGA